MSHKTSHKIFISDFVRTYLIETSHTEIFMRINVENPLMYVEWNDHMVISFWVFARLNFLKWPQQEGIRQLARLNFFEMTSAGRDSLLLSRKGFAFEKKIFSKNLKNGQKFAKISIFSKMAKMHKISIF